MAEATVEEAAVDDHEVLLAEAEAVVDDHLADTVEILGLADDLRLVLVPVVQGADNIHDLEAREVMLTDAGPWYKLLVSLTA